MLSVQIMRQHNNQSQQITIISIPLTLVSQMNQINKKNIQPVIRLVPQQPDSSSRLMVYCSTPPPDKHPISYKARWFRVNPQTLQRQQLYNHQVSSYQCSPFDINHIIEALILYNDRRIGQGQKVVAFPKIKIKRQLQQRRLYVMEPIPCKIQVEGMGIEVKACIQNSNLILLVGEQNSKKHNIHLNDLSVELIHNSLGFRMHFSDKFPQFLHFFSQWLGKSLKISNMCLQFYFNDRISRDLILYIMNEQKAKIISSSFRENRKKVQINPQHRHQKSKKDTSLSLKKRSENHNKIKVTEQVKSRKHQMQSGLKKTKQFLPQFTHILTIGGDQFNLSQNINLSNDNDLPSMDLRDSFAQFENSTNHNMSYTMSHVNQDGKSTHSYRMQQNLRPSLQIQKLKQENYRLQAELDNLRSIRQEYFKVISKNKLLEEQIKKVQMGTQSIIADKLKFESKYIQERKQKQLLRQQYQALKMVTSAGNQFGGLRETTTSSHVRPVYNRPHTPDSRYYQI